MEGDAQQKSSSSRKETTSEDKFDRLERTLEQFQENARIMGSMAADFTTRSQDQFNQKIHTFISGLQQMDAMKHEFDEVKVPLELMEVLDRGETPFLYSKEILEKTQLKNEEVNGKIEMYRKFRASLLKHMGEEMPGDTVKYLTTRKESEAAKQVMQNAAAAMSSQKE
ncbi:hypothetical protein PENTCL1PPCAC_7280 [Pristionchus entomophagus]|uniref:Mediator of RNA polymerase II transcription subunit 10 n=1 Tax=Pristionchus entomophagus TaxID=358040 RepID=A0AAV5SR94_9BILA|nr:hypothetical protein PENTCL1PPCAC_7280 [Pristionchus entomophagus]